MLPAGTRVISWPSIRTDLVNTGTARFDAELVEEGHRITSFEPGNDNAFCSGIRRQTKQAIPWCAQPPGLIAQCLLRVALASSNRLRLGGGTGGSSGSGLGLVWLWRWLRQWW